MKTIYFVRHGSTHGVENDVYQQFDIPLSEIGKEQAVKAAVYFKGVKIDSIIASTMTRASETAEIIKEHASLSAPIKYTDLYHEGHRPTAVRGKSKHDPEVKEIISQTTANFANENWKHSDEENYFDFKRRASAALDYVASQPEENIMVVTHATFLKFILAMIILGESLTPEAVRLFKYRFKIQNTSISKVELKDGQWTVVSWNDHGHLLDAIE